MRTRGWMKPLERLSLALSGQKADRIPFVPAIYEHKAFLINKSPSEVCQDYNLLIRALEAEYEIYQADLLVVGIDVYNVEAEALGARVGYCKTNETPSISRPVLVRREEIDNLQMPDPAHDGRMSLMIRAGRKIARRIGDEVMIWGAMSGPFTLASRLLGEENLLLMTIKDPDWVCKSMGFCTKVLMEYGKAWMEAGLGIIVFDSFCSPPMISPQVYRQLVMPYHTKLMGYLKKSGSHYCPLIIGGNTTKIAEDIAKTGANFILCDYNADLKHYLRVVKDAGITLRANINPELIYRGPFNKIIQAGEEIIRKSNNLPRFILGTGVLPYDTPQEHVIALKSCTNRIDLQERG